MFAFLDLNMDRTNQGYVYGHRFNFEENGGWSQMNGHNTQHAVANDIYKVGYTHPYQHSGDTHIYQAVPSQVRFANSCIINFTLVETSFRLM